MPRNLPPFGGYDDQDVERVLTWMLELLGEAEWNRRRDQIEVEIEATLTPQLTRSATLDLHPVSVAQDRVAWYLYLVDSVLHSPLKYEPTQGARVVPIFKRLGSDFELLKSIAGVEERVVKMLTTERRQPDGALFELLVGIIWARNGATYVEFLEEAPPARQPDILAHFDNRPWYIECKRLSKSSAYSEEEREKWLRMWSHASEVLISERRSIVLDIEFHVELETLPDNYLTTQLCGKLAFIQAPCTVLSNEICEVAIIPIDYDTIRDHLSRYMVKYPSDQIMELIGGRREPNRGFTSAIEGRFVRMGGGTGNNYFLNDLTFAVGAFWSCDAERAIERKARDIRGHLADAVGQLPDGERGVVHVGLETLDGQIVEAERYRRIFDTVQRFDSENKDLRWVYCHLFQSYAPPSECWIIDETVYYFGRSDQETNEPISRRSAVVPEDELLDDNPDVPVHWLRTPP